MAKRVANQQMTKNGTISDEDGFSVGSQIGEPQKATAAQMAQRRLAKPRGGRRPGALRPPASPSSHSFQQQQSSFGEGDRINPNGIQQQQGGFNFGQQANGFQSNQNSSSFPPFPSNSFNSSFSTPTTGFNFSAGQAQEVNNPFTAINTHNAPPPEPTGFQGSIFTLPPQKMSPFQRFLEGEQKPLFAPGAPEISSSSQSQHSNNLFNQSTNQHQLNQASLGVFTQPDVQQQPSNNTFGQSTETIAPQPSVDMFAHLKTPQNQSSDNPFAQSISHFQQSQSAQPTANLFAHLGQPQPPSSFLTQGSTSPTESGSSMMQISPDPSPQSRPFGFLNQSNTQTQSSPTKNSTAQGGGGSLFDRITKPPPETSFQPQSSQTKDTLVEGGGNSLFDRISKPSTEANAPTSLSPTKTNAATDKGNLFIMPQQSDTSKVSNGIGATSPTKISERKIAKPTLFNPPSEGKHPSYKAIFGNLKMPPTSQPSHSPAPTGLSAISQPSSLQTKVDFALPKFSNSSTPSASVSTQHSSDQTKTKPNSRRNFGPPPAPEGYSEEEAQKWSQDWWISFCVRHEEKRIMHAKSQCAEMVKAILNGWDPLKQIAGSKRKPVIEKGGGQETETQEKKARVESPSVFTQEARRASNGTGATQSHPKGDTLVQQATNKNNKRSAEEEPQRDDTQGTADNGKKARGHDSISYPSLAAISPGSQTSSIFKNILDQKEEAKINGTQKDKATPLPQLQAPLGSSSNQSQSTSKPTFATSVPPSSKSDIDSPSTSSFSSFNPGSSPPSSRLFANEQSVSKEAPVTGSIPSFKPSSSSAVSLTASTANPFSFKPNPNSEAPSDATKALAVKFSSGATTSKASNLTPFSIKPALSSQTSSEDAKAPAFKVPTFGAAPTSTASNSSPFSMKPSTSGQTSSEDAKAPAFKVPTFDAAPASTASNSSPFSMKPSTSGQTSSEDAKAPAFKVPTFGAAPASTASNSSPFSTKPSTSGQTSSEAPKAPAFKVPTFGAGASPTNFMAQFSKAAEKTEEEAMLKRKADEYDSEEEESASWEVRDAKEQRMKRQKFEEETRGKTAKLVDGKWVIFDKKQSASANEAESADPNVSVLSRPYAPLTNGHNIFGHLSGEESGAEGSKTGDVDDEADEVDKNDGTQEQHHVRGPFDYDSSSSESDEDEGESKEPKAGSIFDRISRDQDGKPIRDIPQAGDQANSQKSNIFGQSFNSGSSSNLFSQPSDAVSSSTSPNSKTGDSPKGDHTWKVDSPIRFGVAGNPPAVNVTSPSPSKPTFGGLFGAAKPNVTTETPTKPTSSVFTTTPTKTPSVGFGFSFKPAAASLAPPSNNGSTTTSRATSPGATTGESANESTADAEDDKAEEQEQIDLTSPGPGEEDEDVVLQVKAKALKWDTASSSWVSHGVGPLRVLKNRESHQTRTLLRQDPSGRIVLNFALSKSFAYESSQSKTVRMPIVSESGKIESWMIKVGNDDDAKKLASALEENKN